MSILSLGLLLPLGAGVFPDQPVAMLTDAARASADVRTRGTTVDEFLAGRSITRQAEGTVSSDSDAPNPAGTEPVNRPAELVVDGISRPSRTAAATVGDALAAQGLRLGPHDVVAPGAQSAVEADATISVTRATSWLEHVRTSIPPPVVDTYAVGLARGIRRVVDAGVAGSKETIVEVSQPDPAVAPTRHVLAARVLRAPRAKVIARGVSDDSALAGIARRSAAGTLRLADAALRMVATAYTAACGGCSGTTASGRPAGHGVVAVDPRYIPLGTRLYIPGYGPALAADTGGAIHGDRIDLGFDSHRDALSFGRRPVVVYVLK